MARTAQPAKKAAAPAAAEPAPLVDNTDRWTYGLIAVAIGVISLLIAFALVVWRWRGDGGISAIGVIASPIAAMVAAYFGVQAATTAAKDSQASAKSAQKAAFDSQQSATTAHARAAAALTALDVHGHEDTANQIRALLPGDGD